MFKYSVTLQWSEEDEGYVATIPELPGVSAIGKTMEEATQEVQIAAELCLESLKEDKKNIPTPSLLSEYSGQLRLRMPKTLHQKLTVLAEKEGVSLNSQIVFMLSETFGQKTAALQIQTGVIFIKSDPTPQLTPKRSVSFSSFSNPPQPISTGPRKNKKGISHLNS